MKPVEFKKDVYWVGGIDWKLRDFHGYRTQRGSTYNSYLIKDEKIVLVDTVKHYLYDEMLARIREIVDPAKIDYVVSNHVEMDHSGCLPRIMQLAKNAVLLTSPNGEKGLRRHFKQEWNFKVVKTGETINIGKRNLQFVQVPMVHWPDSMVTYVPEDKLLLPNDAFGQHIASAERFDDQLGFDVIKEEAAKYYANIVLPYGAQVSKALAAVGGLEIEMIAPSHGLIWRKHIPEIISLYQKWAANECEQKAVIVYDTMWGSTEKMAYRLGDVFEEKGIPFKLLSLKENHISDIMTAVLTARYICVGSPTLNSGMLPTVAAFLTYLKGLAPKSRVGIAFGSYGWGARVVGEIEDILKSLGFDVPLTDLRIQYVPDEKELGDFASKIRETI